MRVWLLSHLVRSPGNRLMLEAAARLGVDMTLVEPGALSLRIGGAGLPPLGLYDQHGPLELPARVLTRMGSSSPQRGFEVLRHLEAAGVPCINRAESLALARDKVLTFQRLACAGVPLPPTVVVGQQAPLETLLAPLGPPPWVVKLPVAAQGQGVALAESLPALRALLDLMEGLKQRALVQHFVREAGGVDIRVLVVEGQAVAAMRRKAGPGEFRSNLHRGGAAEEVGIFPALAEVAERAARALDLTVAGVDLLPGGETPVVAEVNGSPGLEGLQAATSRDLAAELLTRLGFAAPPPPA
ncbi:MAG: RimK family alpha-L-glutamate ligase [Planctomycetota bacterium]